VDHCRLDHDEVSAHARGNRLKTGLSRSSYQLVHVKMGLPFPYAVEVSDDWPKWQRHTLGRT